MVFNNIGVSSLEVIIFLDKTTKLSMLVYLSGIMTLFPGTLFFEYFQL